MAPPRAAGAVCAAALLATAASASGVPPDAVGLMQNPLETRRALAAGDVEGEKAQIPRGVCAQKSTEQFQDTADSLKTHKTPSWFKDAKLGIFIHWGLYSVPAYAEKTLSFDESSKYTQEYYFAHNPYAEWYLHTGMTKNSTTSLVHKSRYGEEMSESSYLRNFVPAFNKQIGVWNPVEWAALFKDVGAKYVVLTTKNHDGFCLWPSKARNHWREDKFQHAARDIVGELTTAVRSTGMEMGFYYSGGFDWSFSMCPGKPCEVKDPFYEKLAYAHIQELVDKYGPAILWNDIGWPGADANPKRLYKFFASYLNEACPQGAIDQRWISDKAAYQGDFDTPEYDNRSKIVSHEFFEMSRGIGRSFGLNAEEGSADYMSPEEVVWLLSDVVARNGNLLLGVGPRPDGSIPEGQRLVLNGLASWMQVNGEAIHGSTPFLNLGEQVEQDVRYTRKGDVVFAIIRCPQKCKKGAVQLGASSLMQKNWTAELLGTGGPTPLTYRGQHSGWKLPKGTAKGTMPLVIRFGEAAPQKPSFWSRRRGRVPGK